MSKISQFLMIATAALLFGTIGSAQSTAFLSVPTASQTNFAKPANTVATVRVINGTVTPGTTLPASDAIVGMPFRVLPEWSSAEVDCANAKSTRIPIRYGSTGYVMFSDGQGGGVGWQLGPNSWQLSQSGGAWVINKVNGKWVMQIQLYSPFWIAPPTNTTSPSMIQMMNASSATLTLALNSLPGGTNLSNISPKQFCSVTSGTTVSTFTYGSNGSLELYR